MAGITQVPTPMNRPVRSLELPMDADRMLLFFGYVDCPHVCPTTMTALRETYDQYGDDNARLSVVFVNLTEADDGVADGYAKNFNDNFVGIQASIEDRPALLTELGVRYARSKSGPTGWHTDSVYVLARNGRTWNLRTVVQQTPIEPKALAALVKEL